METEEPAHTELDLDDLIDVGDLDAHEAALVPIYSKFGQAMALVQAIEMFVVQMVAAVRFDRHRRRRPHKRFEMDGLLDRLLKQTLGANISELASIVDPVPRRAELDLATELRNHLAHAFWRDRLILTAHHAGREAVTAELDEILAWLVRLSENLAIDALRSWTASGLDAGDIETIGVHLSAVANGNASMTPYWRLSDGGPPIVDRQQTPRPIEADS